MRSLAPKHAGRLGLLRKARRQSGKVPEAVTQPLVLDNAPPESRDKRRSANSTLPDLRTHTSNA